MRRFVVPWALLIIMVFALLANATMQLVVLPSYQAQAQTTLQVVQLQPASYTQLWMAEPFLAHVWYSATPIPAEPKGDELHIGAGYKLDLPMPAWVALRGRQPNGTWELDFVAKANEQAPGSAFHAVMGISLATIATGEVSSTPSRTLAPIYTPTYTPLPPPTGGWETVVPPIQITPARPWGITLYCSNTAEPFFRRFGQEVTYVLPRAWCGKLWDYITESLPPEIDPEELLRP